MNKISISGETYSNIPSKLFNLYSAFLVRSSWTIWRQEGVKREEDKKLSVERVIIFALKKYNRLLTSGRWSTEDPKYEQILDLVGLAHKLMNESKKTYNMSNKESTKGEPAYIRDLLSWIM